MTFRHLEAFVQVARQGGFTRAAEILLLTQPTVSGQIRELEEELGVSLFHRLPRAVELTEAGRILLPRAEEVLERRDGVLAEAAAYRGLLWGRLEVCASTIPGEYLLPPVLTRFKRAHPGVRAVLRIRDTGEVLDRVARGEAPLGVVGERDGRSDLAFRPLWTDRVGLFCAPGVSPDVVERLDGLPLVMREEGSGTRRVAERALARAGIDPARLDVVAELGSTTAVKEALKGGDGAGFLSERAVAGEVAAGVLVPVAVSGALPVERRFYAVWHPKRALSPAASAFRSALEAAAADG